MVIRGLPLLVGDEVVVTRHGTNLLRRTGVVSQVWPNGAVRVEFGGPGQQAPDEGESIDPSILSRAVSFEARCLQ